MKFTDLLHRKGIDPKHVLVLRHRPWETKLNKVFPWLAAEKPDLFNAFQQSHSKKVEKAVTQAKYVASFIAHEPGKALFVGLYANKGHKTISSKQFWQIPANVALKALGMNGFAEEANRTTCLWFNLVLTDFYADWKGKLIIHWPPLDRNWHRWAHKPKNQMPIFAILDESELDGAVPEWDAIEFSWEDLSILPRRLKSKLHEWRGIYYIFDTFDGKGYVGSAYGESNLLGRWQNYAAGGNISRGHGGNRLLRKRDPRNFRFTILERLSPDMKKVEVERAEASWKSRLHTRKPYGLNDN